MRVSVVMAVWNTSHLLRRTLHTLTQQTYDDFEVIIIDDNSEDDVQAVVDPYKGRLDIKVHRLEHDIGMRGNTVSFNVGFSLAQGDLILENTSNLHVSRYTIFTTPRTRPAIVPSNTVMQTSHEPYVARSHSGAGGSFRLRHRVDGNTVLATTSP